MISYIHNFLSLKEQLTFYSNNSNGISVYKMLLYQILLYLRGTSQGHH
jgi:hypothetical protein